MFPFETQCVQFADEVQTRAGGSSEWKNVNRNGNTTPIFISGCCLGMQHCSSEESYKVSVTVRVMLCKKYIIEYKNKLSLKLSTVSGWKVLKSDGILQPSINWTSDKLIYNIAIQPATKKW